MADRAILVGINEYGTISGLRGCLNDVQSIRDLLVQSCGFPEANIRTLVDSQATKRELSKQWKWLLNKAVPGDRLVFHFSGHGSHHFDQNGDESDGVDELLCLYGMDWHEPETYLLDDELAEWTKLVPEGVSLTILLDCCHSGTGTRLVQPPSTVQTREFSPQRSALVDVQSSLRRLELENAQAVGLERSPAAAADRIRDVIPESTDDIGRKTVLARFVEPPPEVIQRFRKFGKRRTFAANSRGGGSKLSGVTPDRDMNHVLISGSSSAQTSADAWIEGDYRGAFSWHLCEAVSSAASSPRLEKLIQTLRKRLSAAGFTQTPQLEPAGISGPFLGETETSRPKPKVNKTDNEDGNEGDWGASGGGVSAEQWERLVASVEQLASTLGAISRQQFQRSGLRSNVAGSTGRALVYVHGICYHEPKYSEGWWKSLSKHLSPQLAGELEVNRHEVLWSRHVSPAPKGGTTRSAVRLQLEEEEEYHRIRDQLRAVLNERSVSEASAAMRSISPAFDATERGEEAHTIPDQGTRALFGIPGLDCVDDFAKYLASDAIRKAVVNEFLQVVGPLLDSGKTIDVISHSWGTVVAYEGLRLLENRSSPGSVLNLFTVGSALAVSYVRNSLRPKDGKKPSMVDRWVNLDAKGDIVGGSLRAVGLPVNAEYLELEPVGCPLKGRFMPRHEPACAHSSYFDERNRTVNRDIFAVHMNR